MKKNKQGFSMVEVITAMVIVSTLAAGIFAATSFSKRMDVTAQQELIAMSRVEEQMNLLKQQGAAALGLSTDRVPDSANLCYSDLPNCATYDELNGTMTVFVSSIIKDTDPASPPAKEVVVRADWKDSLGAVRSESAATFLQG